MRPRHRLLLYFALSRPVSSSLSHVRYFQYGIPWIMKRSQFAKSSETVALRFLHATGLNLPIPRVIDSVTVDGEVWTIMTRLQGDTMLNLARKKAITDKEVQGVVKEVHEVIRKLWTLTPPISLEEQTIMHHPSGEGLPWAKFDLDFTIGPCSLVDLYAAYTTALATHQRWTARDIINLEPDRMRKILSDKVVYVHCDLRPLNIMVHNGRFTGIIDWENSGWHVRHWQVLVVRRSMGLTNPVKLSRWWRDVKFEPDVEEAYQAGCELLEDKI
ncbi:hypothetical protein D9619_010706 [Psilocybe cf. subviscida]|uniref:Aminoglycoside phosphotransferase domain-containing protein n=1 Tax=Psilocybe cf. subviscida TaxID=2480587 RepID=A0A8H5B914_9AGAR|nr:hypothetical protein D9619_010706 [Psilocybe cf. subviscida]